MVNLAICSSTHLLAARVDDDDVQLCLMTWLFVRAKSDFVAAVISCEQKLIQDDSNFKE